MNKQTVICFTIGIPLILFGLFVPSSMLVESLRTTPVSADLLEQLLLGAKLFRIGLAILGILIITIGRINILRLSIQNENSESPLNRKMILVALSVILLIASGMRLYGLDYGLWYDEIRAYVTYMGIPTGELLTTYDSENNHVLFTLLARASFEIFDGAPWSMRLPAVLFGVSSIWALYFLARQVVSEREALLSAALLTFSYHHIWFSQNARGYTGLLFWTLLSSWFFLRALREDSSKIWVFYAVTVALGMYTHMTMTFIVFTHFVIFLISIFIKKDGSWARFRSGFFFGFCVAALLTFQLYALILPQLLNSIGEQSNVTTWKNPLWTFFEFIRGLKISLSSGIVAIGALVVTSAGLWSFLRQNPSIIGLLFLSALVGSTAVIAMGHPLWPRFFFFLMGFGLLVIVRGTTILGQLLIKLPGFAPKQSAIVGTAICSVLIIASISSLPRVYAPKQDYEGALAFVNHVRKPGDAIVTVGLTAYTYRNYYKTNWEEVKTVEKLDFIRHGATRTLLLYTLPLHIQGEYPDIMTVIQKEFRVIEKYYGTLNGGIIFICLSEGTSS
jgi:hypothetical protein